MGELRLPGIGDLQTFGHDGARLSRRMTFDGRTVLHARLEDGPSADPLGAWHRRSLGIGGPAGQAVQASGQTVTTADLCSGIGGLSAGLDLALAELGHGHRTALVADHDPEAAELAGSALGADRVHAGPVEGLSVDSTVEMIVAGPPCQGFSLLNQTVRRGEGDERRSVYVAVAELAARSDADRVLLENVPNVGGSGEQAEAVRILSAAGFWCRAGVIAADSLGWPQMRRRHFLAARRSSPPAHPVRVGSALAAPARPLSWALDLDYDTRRDIMHTPSSMTPIVRARCDYLHDHGLFDALDLPDGLCPNNVMAATGWCSFSRMRPDRPSGTIVGQFGPNEGRFFHPFERRKLTLAEGAAIQGFPLRWWDHLPDGVGRGRVARWISNAVPPILGHAAALAVLLDD